METKLLDARKKAGLSQDALAKSVGITEQGYRNYERGKRIPRVDTAVRIASTLGTTAEEIWGECGAQREGMRWNR